MTIDRISMTVSITSDKPVIVSIINEYSTDNGYETLEYSPEQAQKYIEGQIRELQAEIDRLNRMKQTIAQYVERIAGV